MERKEMLNKPYLNPEQRLIGAIFPKIDIELIHVTPGLKQKIEEILKTITPRQARVVVARYKELKTLKETGREFYLTGEGVRLVEKKALRRLRHPTRRHIVLDCLEMKNN